MSSKREIIGILSWDYALPKGGMGVSLARVADQLRGGGMTVRVLSPSPDEGRPLLGFTRRAGGHLLFSLLLPFVLGGALRRAGARTVLLPVGPGGVWLLRRPRVRVLAVVYHTYLQQSRLVPGQRWKRLFLPLERRALRAAARVICYCEDTRRVLEEDYGLRNVTMLPHAVDLREPAPRKDPAHVVCVARLEARKGVDVLLAVWPAVKEKLPQARLTIVGRGRGEKAVDRVIGTLNGVERISGLTRGELDALVAGAAVSACPAYLEGFGLAAAEAMACGTAVVGSDTDGLRSLLQHERTGLLVPAGDGGALAGALVRLMEDGALRERLAAQARDRIRDLHDPDACARAIVDAVTALA